MSTNIVRRIVMRLNKTHTYNELNESHIDIKCNIIRFLGYFCYVISYLLFIKYRLYIISIFLYRTNVFSYQFFYMCMWTWKNSSSHIRSGTKCNRICAMFSLCFFSNSCRLPPRWRPCTTGRKPPVYIVKIVLNDVPSNCTTIRKTIRFRVQ